MTKGTQTVAEEREHIYVVDRFPSYSETFVATEISSIIESGASVSVYSIHRPTAHYAGVAPYVARPLAAWQLLPWVLPGLLLLAAHFVGGLRMEARAIPKMIFAAAHSVRLASFLSARRGSNRRSYVLHPHFLARPTDVAILASALIKAPVVVTSHAGDAKDKRDPQLRRWRVAGADHIFAASKYVQSNLSSHEETAPTSIVHCGIEFSKLPPSVRSTTTNDQLVVVTIARLIATKGYDRAVSIVQHLAEASTKPITWHVIGEGPMREQLEKAQKTLATLKVNLVVHGALDHDAALAILADSDLFLLPSVVTHSHQNAGDGIPVSILEAMALGKIVLTTGAGGIPEAIVDGETGLLIQDQTDGEIANRTVSLLADAVQSKKISDQARTKILAEFQAKASAEAILKTVDLIVAGLPRADLRTDSRQGIH